MKDESLLSRIKAGDQAAFEELLKANDARLYNIALKITRDRTAAEDAVYDTYEQLIRRVDRIRDPAALQYWLISSVKHRSIDYLRKYDRLVRIEASNAENAARFDSDREQIADVNRCMMRLPEAQAKALLMYTEGLKLKEIAKLNGISLTSAWSLIDKAKKNFIKYYNKD